MWLCWAELALRNPWLLVLAVAFSAKLAPGELLRGQQCPQIPGNVGARLVPGCQLGFCGTGAGWWLLPQGHSQAPSHPSAHSPSCTGCSCCAMAWSSPGLPLGTAAQGQAQGTLPAAHRARGQCQGSWAGARSGVCQAGCKVPVRGHQMQAELEGS